MSYAWVPCEDQSGGGKPRIRIVAGGQVPDDEWDAYRSRKADATIYHTSAWRRFLVRETRRQDNSLVAVDSGDVVGILPLIWGGLPPRRRLASLPLSMYGGPVADRDDIVTALLAAAFNQARDMGARIDVRCQNAVRETGLIRTAVEYDARIRVERDGHGVPSHPARPEARRAVRKFEKSGGDIQAGNRDLIVPFHSLYVSHRQALGLPANSRGYLDRMLSELSGGILIARVQQKAAAGVLYLKDASRTYYALPVAQGLGRAHGAPDALVHALYDQATAQGAVEICLGGSGIEQPGLRRFKRKWGAVERPIYRYHIPDGKQTDEKLKTMGLPGWKRLPSAVAGLIGPWIVKGFA